MFKPPAGDRGVVAAQENLGTEFRPRKSRGRVYWGYSSPPSGPNDSINTRAPGNHPALPESIARSRRSSTMARDFASREDEVAPIESSSGSRISMIRSSNPSYLPHKRINRGFQVHSSPTHRCSSLCHLWREHDQSSRRCRGRSHGPRSPPPPAVPSGPFPARPPNGRSSTCLAVSPPPSRGYPSCSIATRPPAIARLRDALAQIPVQDMPGKRVRISMRCGRGFTRACR